MVMITDRTAWENPAPGRPADFPGTWRAALVWPGLHSLSSLLENAL